MRIVWLAGYLVIFVGSAPLCHRWQRRKTPVCRSKDKARATSASAPFYRGAGPGYAARKAVSAGNDRAPHIVADANDVNGEMLDKTLTYG